MSNNSKVSDVGAALSTAKDDRSDIYTLSTGVRVRLRSVSTMLTRAAMQQIKDPPIPIVVDEQQGREYENPNDPVYLEKLTQASLERGYARLNTIILWGVELVDGLPPDSDWLDKLRLMDKHGLVDLSDFDFNDPIDKEFAYKKFIVIGDAVDEDGGNADLTVILNRGSVSEEAIEQASDTFQGEETQPANSDSTPEKSEVVS